MKRRTFTREQALAWNPDWSPADLRIIELNFARLGTETFYSPPSGGYVNCVDARGRIVMMLAAGYVEFKADVAPAGCEPGWPGIAFSTFRPRDGATTQPEDNPEVCPVHFVALPRTGLCDQCE